MGEQGHGAVVADDHVGGVVVAGVHRGGEPRPALAEVLAQRKQFLNPGLFLYYKQPIMIVEGKMQYVWDDSGKRYLDGLGGIVTVSVGHCHPHVLKAINAQNATLQHSTTIYLNPNIGAFAEKLASKFPGDLKVCYFVNSGSEANDLALLMARLYTGNYDVVRVGGTPSADARVLRIPIVGAIAMSWLDKLVWRRFPLINLLILGVAVMMLVLFLPRGIVGTILRARPQWRRFIP